MQCLPGPSVSTSPDSGLFPAVSQGPNLCMSEALKAPLQATRLRNALPGLQRITAPLPLWLDACLLLLKPPGSQRWLNALPPNESTQ